MKALCKNLWLSFSPPQEAPLSEEERLLEEIEETRKKIDYAWNHFNYAAPDYVELAVLELLLVETHYGILNKRYRLLLGLKDENPYYMPSAAKALSSLERNFQNHALYKSLINPTSETLSSGPETQITSLNHYDLS